ncbi:MAG: efflux RND transporter periplasmic adaptor subunit [Myxococcales bacterium]|nr:MAG: efflux RND transporter periplasmic adaptor subunit [Myxococcales bacterium]
MIRRNLLIHLMALALGIGFGACSSKTKEQHAKHDNNDAHKEGIVVLTAEAATRVRIRTSPVQNRVLSGVISTTGRVDFNQDNLAHVSPRVPGRVHQVHAVLGAQVKKGQSLAVIDSISFGQAKSTFLQAKAQLELATSTLEREQGLLADQITSQQSVLEAQASHQRANATFQSARQQLRLLGLSNRQIDSVSYDDSAAALFPLPAPISGTIVEKHISLGEIVSPGNNVFTVADLSSLWIWIDIYERDLAHVHLDDDVVLSVDTFPDQISRAK